MAKFENSYIKTNWVDHIIDVEKEEIIQEGTRFTASRANNIEEGIFNLYYELGLTNMDLEKLRIQLGMIGRVPVNNGTFFDPISDTESGKSLRFLSEMSVLQSTKEVGATTLEVEDENIFNIGETVTVLDDVSMEDVKITGITGATLTVSALTKAYKKGALVVRTNMVVSSDKLGYGNWGNYDISIREVN